MSDRYLKAILTVIALELLFVLLIGLIMDPLAAMVILVPILLPTVTQLGIDQFPNVDFPAMLGMT